MQCCIHGDRQAAGTCVACRRAFCQGCVINVGGHYYCATCAPVGPGVGAHKSPALAVVLSFFIVGLGQLYNGQTLKGILMLVAGIIGGAVTAVLSFFLIGFLGVPVLFGLWVWSMIDAGVVAAAINRGGLPRPVPLAAPPARAPPAVPAAQPPRAAVPAPARPAAAPPAPVPPRVQMPDVSDFARAFRDHRQAENLVSNLEKMRAAGAVTETEYDSMRGSYLQRLNEATVRLEAAREALRREVTSAQSRIEALRKELRESELRHKVGEVSEQAHLADRQRLEPTINEIQALLDQLEEIMRATDPEELKPYIREKEPEPVAARPAPQAPARPMPAPVRRAETVSPTGDAAAALAKLGAQIPLTQQTAERVAWLCVGAMFVAAMQPLPWSGAGSVIAILAALTAVAAAVCVVASDEPSFRLGRAAAAGFGVLLWLIGIAFLGARISWWFFGFASVGLLVGALVQLRD